VVTYCLGWNWHFAGTVTATVATATGVAGAHLALWKGMFTAMRFTMAATCCSMGTGTDLFWTVKHAGFHPSQFVFHGQDWAVPPNLLCMSCTLRHAWFWQGSDWLLFWQCVAMLCRHSGGGGGHGGGGGGHGHSGRKILQRIAHGWAPELAACHPPVMQLHLLKTAKTFMACTVLWLFCWALYLFATQAGLCFVAQDSTMIG